MSKPVDGSFIESASSEGDGYRFTVGIGAARWPEGRVGGKADGLHRLVRHGFEVPRAFCIVTDVFEAVVERCAYRVDNLDQLREALLQVELPRGLDEEVEARMKAIGAGRWAVRSSALEEDALHHSFAGQQESVLGAQSPSEVLSAVREVWASLYDIGGVLYRNQLDIELVPRAMGVVVQQMVTPTAAGVMFTQNPVTGDRRQVVINAAHGLGTKVVGGGPADTYYLDKSTGYVERHERGGQPDESRSAGVLSADQLDELVHCARRIDEIFDHPQDVEWAFAPQSSAEAESGIGGRLFLLQSRPITETRSDQSQSNVYTNVNVGEALPGVATPMTWSIIRDFSRRGFEWAFGSLGLDVPEEYELVGSFRGRIYLNLTEFMSVARTIPLLEADTLFEMAGGGGLELVRDVEPAKGPAEFIARLPVTAARVIGSQVSMPVVARVWERYFEGRREAFFQRDLTRLNHRRFGRLLGSIDELFDRTGRVMLSCSSNFLMSFVSMRALLKLWGDPKALESEKELVSGLEVDSTKPGIELLDLGRIARRSRRLRRVLTQTEPGEVLESLEELRGHDDVDLFLEELEAFRRRHGHRAPREAELATPRWREETRFLFEVVRGYVRASSLPRERQLERERQERQEAIDRLIARTFPPGVEAGFRALVGLTRENARLRESMRTRVVEMLDIYRRYFLECGRRMVLQDALERPEDVFYLTRDEIERWLDDVSIARDFAVRVLVRRALKEKLAALPDPPATFVLEDGEMIEESAYLEARTGGRVAEPGDDVPVVELRGLPGSGGRATGRVRILQDPNEDASLEPGEVLVAPYTDVGWTPLFLTASAVVTSLGGPLSHSCIVAREYGIPAVVNAREAVETLRDGDLVTVDGDRGVVYVREKSGE
ncbi:MAG: PEP/pyruvate-binding domain-containing protein [Persicimonas sp.]